MTQTGYTSGAESFVQFLTVFLVFLLVIVLTYFTTRFVGSFQKKASFNRNFEAVETIRITNGKYLQLVRVGKKYIVIGIAKDSVNFITEVNEDDIDLSYDDKGASEAFRDIMDKARQRISKGDNKNEK